MPLFGASTSTPIPPNHLRPAAKQQIEFFLPSDKLSQPARVEAGGCLNPLGNLR